MLRYAERIMSIDVHGLTRASKGQEVKSLSLPVEFKTEHSKQGRGDTGLQGSMNGERGHPSKTRNEVSYVAET